MTAFCRRGIIAFVASMLAIVLLAAACGGSGEVESTTVPTQSPTQVPTAAPVATPSLIPTLTPLPTPTRTSIPAPTVTPAIPSPASAAELSAIIRHYYDALDRGDVAAAAAVFASDAEALFPWLVTSSGRGITQIQKDLQTTVNVNTRFTVISVTASTADESKVTARLEIRNRVTAQMRFERGERGILAVTAIFAGNKIIRLNQEFDLTDPPTARIADYQRLVNEDAARATSTQPATPASPFVPAWREIAPPPNGDVPNWQWIELDAPENYKLIAAVLRPPGPGPFSVIVFLHGGGGLDRAYLPSAERKGFVAAGFIAIVGMWFNGENPMNLPTVQPIRWPAAPPYTISYVARLKYADALVQTARLLPGADAQRVCVFGLSQGGTEAVLLASPGKGLRAVVSDSGQYSRNFGRTDTPPVTAVRNLDAPLLLLHGTADGTVPVQEAYDLEAALRQFNKPYEAHYYEGAKHGVDSGSNTPQVRADAVARTLAFFKKHLGAP